MKLGDGKLPPFIGYLPPIVDGVLLELMNMSHKDYPPRAGRTGKQLAEPRRMAIASLFDHFKRHPHERAIQVFAAAMRRRQPFCLYLRNFGLGARAYPARNDPFGLPQVMTLMPSQFDSAMQGLIQTAVAPKVPSLCISNPSGDFGDMPAFIVADEEWESLARTLVKNCGLIVMYFLSLTSGVASELDLLRSEGRQDATLIVIEEEDPFEDKMGMGALFQVRRNEPPSQHADLGDFPHQFRRKGEEGWKALGSKLEEMAQGELRGPVEPRVGLPLESVPPEPLRKYCTDMATKEFDAAVKLISEKNYDEAEDVLTRAIAYAHWGRDTLGRAMTVMTLARLNLMGFKAKGEAGAYYEMSLYMCREIQANSPTAVQLIPVIEGELGQLRAEAEAKAKAQTEPVPPGQA